MILYDSAFATLVALTTAAATWATRLRRRRELGLYFLAALGACLWLVETTGRATALYPWSDLLALALAWPAGWLIGRSGPWWLLGILLAAGSAGDLGSFLGGTQQAPTPSQGSQAALAQLANVTIQWSSHHVRLGDADVVAIAAVASNLLRLGARWRVAAGACLMAMLLPELIAAIEPHLLARWHGLPLLPFVLISWGGAIAVLLCPPRRKPGRPAPGAMPPQTSH